MRLLMAAFPPELGPWADAPPEGWRAATCGIGVVTAAAATARLLAEARPRRVLFLGTCGAYDGRLGIGDVVSAARVRVTSLEELRGEAYRPRLETTEWRLERGAPFPPCTVATPPAITRSADGAALLATVAEAEHLELSGVAAACLAAGVPCAAVLAVANPVGPGAHATWKANHERCSQILREALLASGFLQDPPGRRY